MGTRKVVREKSSAAGGRKYNLVSLGEAARNGFTIGHVIARQRVEAAKNGNTDAALDILRDFVGAIDQHDANTWAGARGSPVHWEYAKYIADAFEKILRAAMRSPYWSASKWSDFDTGEAVDDANLALGIKTSKAGRRKGARTHDSEALAASFNLLLCHGFTRKAAKLLLKQKIGAAIRTIELADKEHVVFRVYRKEAMLETTSLADREFALEVLKNGLEPYAQTIASILTARKPKTR